MVLCVEYLMWCISFAMTEGFPVSVTLSCHINNFCNNKHALFIAYLSMPLEWHTFNLVTILPWFKPQESRACLPQKANSKPKVASGEIIGPYLTELRYTFIVLFSVFGDFCTYFITLPDLKNFFQASTWPIL